MMNNGERADILWGNLEDLRMALERGDSREITKHNRIYLDARAEGDDYLSTEVKEEIDPIYKAMMGNGD